LLDNSDKTIDQLLHQKKQPIIEENTVDTRRRQDGGEAQEKDDAGFDNDDYNEAKNFVRVAWEKDSVRVDRPLARQEYMQQYIADNDQEAEKANVEERKERYAIMRRQFEQHWHEDIEAWF